MTTNAKVAEFTGGPVNYYIVEVKTPNQLSCGYKAECSDIIEALGMDFNEGEAFKAIWRKAAQRTLGLAKRNGDALYDAEKVAHYGGRMVVLEKYMRDRLSLQSAIRQTIVKNADQTRQLD